MSSLALEQFTYIEGGCHIGEERFTRNRWMEPQEIAKFREEFGNRGIYLTAYWYDSKQVDEANLYGNFYMDFDSEEDFEKARKDALDAIHYLTRPFFHNIPERFIRIFFSGSKGIHLIIPAEVFGVQPCKELNLYYRKMAEQIEIHLENKTVDFKVYDRRRLFRVPNSIHQKTDLYKIPLTAQELRTLTVDEIIQLALNERHLSFGQVHEIVKARKFYEECIEQWNKRFLKGFNRDRRDVKPLDFVPACVQELIDTGPQKGKRNNSGAALISFWKRQGCSEQETWDYICEWNKESMTETELKTLMKSVYHGTYEYGCSTLEALATCVEHECPLWKGVNR